MDRRVKERLVGATILVVLVVLIVPELLSGPKRAVRVPQSAAPGTAEPMRRVSVDLTTSRTTAATEDAAASSASAAADMPGATGSGDRSPQSPEASPSPATPEAAGVAANAPPPPATVPPAPAPAPIDSGVPSPKAGQAMAKAEAVHHGWAAQLGSFAAIANAEKLERQLRSQGFTPFLSSAGSGKALRYRVRVGPVADRAAAEKLIGRLHKAGHTASVVTP